MAPLSYRRHRFPPEIIQHAIWLYLRFTLSYRDVEELPAERGLDELAAEIGKVLEQEEVHVAYRDRTWTLKAVSEVARSGALRLA
jgi:transposase-like protein